jgi:Flp pilus assembly pilin Flp
LVEYALIAALVSFGAVSGMMVLAGALNKVFAQISSTLGSYTN